MTVILTEPVTARLAEMLGGGFSIQEAVLPAMNRILGLFKFGTAQLIQIAQAVANTIKIWLQIGPCNHDLLASWQAQLLECVRLLLSLSPGDSPIAQMTCKQRALCLLHW